MLVSLICPHNVLLSIPHKQKTHSKQQSKKNKRVVSSNDSDNEDVSESEQQAPRKKPKTTDTTNSQSTTTTSNTSNRYDANSLLTLLRVIKEENFSPVILDNNNLIQQLAATDKNVHNCITAVAVNRLISQGHSRIAVGVVSKHPDLVRYYDDLRELIETDDDSTDNEELLDLLAEKKFSTIDLLKLCGKDKQVTSKIAHYSYVGDLLDKINMIYYEHPAFSNYPTLSFNLSPTTLSTRKPEIKEIDKLLQLVKNTKHKDSETGFCSINKFFQ
jgi:hypothetical protein